MKKNTLSILRRPLGTVLFLMMAVTLYAQEYVINGPVSVNQNETHYYTVIESTTGQPPQNPYNFYYWWYADFAKFVGGSGYGYKEGSALNDVAVIFEEAGADYLYVEFEDGNYNYYYAELEVNVKGLNPPAPPNPVIQSTDCGAVVLKYGSGSQNGATWYWQGKNSNGTCTTGACAGTTYTATSAGWYYLRARKDGLWSTGSSSVYVSSVSISFTLAINGNTDLYSGETTTLSVPSGYGSYQWKKDNQNIPGATSNSYIVSATGSYKVLVNGLCYSNEATITKHSGSNENYVKTYTFKEAGLDPENVSADVDKVNMSVQYFDGLGRPMQQVGYQASPSGQDIVQHIEYDAFGREAEKFLPYVAGTADGTYKPTADTDQLAFYHPTSAPPDAVNVAKDLQPYARTVFEPSPLNRVLKQGAPGEAWQPDEDYTAQDKAVVFEYTTNQAGEVFEWEITESGNCKLTSNTHYKANQLYVTVTKDENWTSGNDGTVREYKDKQGRVVLKRSYESSDELITHDTYYVYDDFGNLQVVLPPEAIKQLGSTFDDIPDDNVFAKDGSLTGSHNTTYYYCPGVTVTLKSGFVGGTNFEIKPYPLDAELVGQYLFTYNYDGRQRMIEKKVPGAEPVYMVYDERDRLVLTQDGNQQKSSQWTFTKYDALNRPVLTGTKVISGDQETVQNAVNAFYNQTNPKPPMFEVRSGDWNGSDHGYSDLSYPKGIDTNAYLSVSYYDDYSYIPAGEPGDDFRFNTANDINNGPHLAQPKGQATGGKVKVLNDNKFLRSTMYYDRKYRVIQSRGDHYMDETMDSYTAYDFIGQVTKTKTVHHINNDKSISMTERFAYDHAGRLDSAWHQMDEQTEVLVAENRYNELGELIDKKLHYDEAKGDYAQSVDYRYNIRGWLTSINNAARNYQDGINDDSNDLFGMNLSYNTDPLGIGAGGMFNGNISAMAWSNASYSGRQKAYAFSYDKLNRIKAANYKEKTSTSWNTNLNHFNVNGIRYDQNGNIEWLNRYESNTLIDELDYRYDGNRLLSVDDRKNHSSGFKDGEESALEYLYDANGNMVTDRNKEIQTIRYNLLNLPEQIHFEDDNYLEYVYDAAGTKLAKKVYENGKLSNYTDYVGGMIFDNDTLKLIQTAEGRIEAALVANDYVWDYQYYLKDHLGNNRVVFTSEEVVYTATMESAHSSTEEAEFKNVAETRVLSSYFNHTPATPEVPSPNKSARLNATEVNANNTRRMIGPAKGLKINAGDKVDMEVWARYQQVNSSETSANAFLFAAMTASFGVTLGENPQIYNALNDIVGATTLINQSPGQVPKAYLNYIFFDKDYKNPVFGLMQVNSTAASGHQRLALSRTFDKEGYLYVYVSNESTLNVNVYFDDLKITHHSPSMVVQANDYYPFGLTFNSSERSGFTTNKFLYNGIELQTDLGWDNYLAEFRSYDPAIGRWGQIDPKTSERESPYVGMANNPILYIDPLGDTIRPGGSEEFLKQYQADRAKIAESEEGRALLKFLDESEKDIYISEATTLKHDILTLIGLDGDTDENNFLSTDTNPTNRGGATVEYSQIEGVEVDGIKTESHHTLNHEFNHAKDYVDGTTYKEMNESSVSEAREKGEIRAVKSTNKIRQREGKAPRTKYTISKDKVIKIH